MPRGRVPVDLDWAEHLSDPRFAHPLQAAKAFEDVDFTDGPTVVALMLYLDKIITGLAEAADFAADQVGRRNFARSVSAAMRDGGEGLGNAADLFRAALWAVFDHHPDLFALRVSKPAEPIG